MRRASRGRARAGLGRRGCNAVARTIARARSIGAEAALIVADAGDAAALAEGVLDHDPYDKAALRVLMRAHAAAGRPASALAAYARVREQLAEDLGVDRAPETDELHTSILLADAPPAGPGSSASPPTHALVGGDAELANATSAELPSSGASVHANLTG